MGDFRCNAWQCANQPRAHAICDCKLIDGLLTMLAVSTKPVTGNSWVPTRLVDMTGSAWSRYCELDYTLPGGVSPNMYNVFEVLKAEVSWRAMGCARCNS